MISARCELFLGLAPQVMRQVREGFDGRRGASGGGRGQLRMAQLVAADKSSRKEAARLGLLNSDEESSDDDKDQNAVDSDDEMGNEELLNRALTERHMGGLGKGGYLDEISSSESENEAEDAADNGESDPCVAEKLRVPPHPLSSLILLAHRRDRREQRRRGRSRRGTSRQAVQQALEDASGAVGGRIESFLTKPSAGAGRGQPGQRARGHQAGVGCEPGRS